MTQVQRDYDDLRESHEKLNREKDQLKKKLEDCEEIQYKLSTEEG